MWPSTDGTHRSGHTVSWPPCCTFCSTSHCWHPCMQTGVEQAQNMATIRAANLQELSSMKHYSYVGTAADDACSRDGRREGDATHPVAKKGGVGLLPSALCSPRIHKDTSVFIFSRPYCTAGHTASVYNTCAPEPCIYATCAT